MLYNYRRYSSTLTTMLQRVGLFILTMMFLANTMIVSAWAQPCFTNSFMNTPVETEVESISESTEMPCHSHVDKTNPAQKENAQVTSNKLHNHCDGLCFCDHALSSQTSVLFNFNTLTAPIVSSDNILTGNDNLYSLTVSPLRRPPRYFS